MQASSPHHPVAAETLGSVVRRFALADVSAHATVQVVGRGAAERDGASLQFAHDRAKRILLAHRPGDDLLEVHFEIFEEILGQVRAVEDHTLIRIVAVVVVPIDDGAGRAGGELQDVHADHADHVGLAGAGQEAVGHHAHQRARNDAKKFLHGRPALDGRTCQFARPHPLIHHHPKLGHLCE